MCTVRSEEIECNDGFDLKPLNGGYVIKPRLDCNLITKYVGNCCLHLVGANRNLKFGFEICMETTCLAYLRRSNLPLTLTEIVPRFFQRFTKINCYLIALRSNEHSKSRRFANQPGSISAVKLVFLRH